VQSGARAPAAEATNSAVEWPSVAWPLLIKTITSMVLISIRPFCLRKIFLILVALLCFSTLCFADPVLMARRCATHSERLVVLKTMSSTWQRSPGPTEPEVAKSPPGDVESVDPALDARATGSAEWIGPSIPPRSSLFPNATCVLRSKDSTANLPNGLCLPSLGSI
jgi:hypothetical protein